jgi:energy-coupling factor transport system substrate-specific component
MNDQTAEAKQNKMLAMAFVPLAIAINVGVGAIVKALNLPLYVDSVGTILATILLGWTYGAIVGMLGFAITSIFINPFAIYFCGTQVAIALFIHLMGKIGWLKNLLKVVIIGIGLGIVAAVVSAPVIIFVFQGATGNGAALVTSFFVKMGNQIVNSIFMSGFSIEPIDKTIQVLLACFILKGIPKSLLEHFKTGTLKKNGFID